MVCVCLVVLMCLELVLFSDRCCVAFVNIYCRVCVVTIGCAVIIRVVELSLVGVDVFVLGVCLWVIGFEVVFDLLSWGLFY